MKNNNPNTRYCPSCGEKLQLGETHCEYCGATYVEKPKPVIESKRIITGFPTKKSKRYLIGMILVMEVLLPLGFLIGGIFAGGVISGIALAAFMATYNEILRRILMGPTVEFFDDGTFTIRRTFRIKAERHDISYIAYVTDLPHYAKNSRGNVRGEPPYFFYTVDGTLLFTVKQCDNMDALIEHYGIELRREFSSSIY